LVVSQRGGAELGGGDEPRPLQVGALRTGGRGRYVGIKRKAREVVAGEEALGREIAIGIEVGSAGGGTTFQQRDLLVGLRLLCLRLSPLLGGETVHLRAAIGIKELLARALVELPPAAERLGKPFGCHGGGRIGECIAIRRPRGGLRSQL